MKNTAELREALIDDLIKLRGGQITRAEARVRSMVARNIIDTLKVELTAAALAADGGGPLLLAAPPGLRSVA